jgi:lysophospholipase L1-like esterase
LPKDVGRTYRVLVAGGSAAECYYLDQPSTWPEVAKRELTTSARLAQLGVDHVHVGSIGKSLVSAEMLDAILTRVLPRYRQLDVLVLMVGASNVANWLMNRAPTAIEEKPLLPSWVFDVDAARRFGWKPGKTAIAEVVRHVQSTVLRAVEVRRGAGAWLDKARHLRRNASTILTEIPDPAVMLDHFERRFRELLTKMRTRVPRVIVVRQPWFRKAQYDATEVLAFWHGAADRPSAEVRETFYSFEIVSRLVALIDDRATLVATELGVEQVDLMPMLEPSLSTFYDFWHFTPAGAATVGKIVADAICGRASALPQEPQGRAPEVCREPDVH